MKTIEERAKEYARTIIHFGHPYSWNIHREGYIKGATEQKAIDIEKAYNLFKEFLIKNGQSEEVIEEKLWDFRRKMEE